MQESRQGDQYIADLEKIRHQAIYSSLTKFRFFFAGLVFAVLSYSIQNPIDTEIPFIVMSEILSWILMLASGLFAIKECGGLNAKLTESAVFEGLNAKYRAIMYGLFVIAMSLMILSRITERACAYFSGSFA